MEGAEEEDLREDFSGLPLERRTEADVEREKEVVAERRRGASGLMCEGDGGEFGKGSRGGVPLGGEIGLERGKGTGAGGESCGKRWR
jgi:hypothetical protein